MTNRLGKRSKPGEYSEVTMVTPWAGRASPGQSIRVSRGNFALQSAKQLSRRHDLTCEARVPEHGLEKFVEHRSEVHKEYIRQEQTTKRCSIIAACTCVVASAALLVFAPEGRETTSYVVGAVLLVVAAGAFGFSTARLTDGKRAAEVSKE